MIVRGVNKFSVGVSVFASLACLTSLSAFVLSSSYSHADLSSTLASVTVDSACTMSAGGNTYTHTFTAAGGTTTLTGDTVAMSCNDSAGFDVYAIGYSGNSYYDTNTDLVFSGNNATYNIKTNGSNGASYWKMKIETSGASNVVTIDNNYDDYSNIPSIYTKIAHFSSNTASGTSNIAPSYQIYISSSQPNGSYTGKVEYKMVHPNNTAAPETPVQLPDPPTTCNTKVPNITYMQDITSSNKSTILASLTEGSPYYLYDSRDNEPYCISKLKDGNLWMLDNLRLGDTSTIILTPEKTNLPASIVSWTLPASINSGFNSYTEAQINTDSKNTTTTSHGAGSGKIGTYYNYCAVSAGYICTNDNDNNGSPNRDICPKGWRIPTMGSSGYQGIFNANIGSDLSLPYSGKFYDSSASDQGSYGFFWSSTRYNSGFMYNPLIYASGADFSYKSVRYYGLPVRCILK